MSHLQSLAATLSPPFPLPSLPPLLTNRQLRDIEAQYANMGLMQRAGSAAVSVIEKVLQLKTNESPNGSIVILCGPGNNGGDGLTVARLLLERKIVPQVVAPVTSALPPDTQQALTAFLDAGGTIHHTLPDAGATTTPPVLIIDALFGIGLNRPPAVPFDGLIRWANDLHTTHGVPVLALDVPSGLESDTGVAHSPTVHATATLSFIAIKPGLLTLDGPDCCGELHNDPLGIAADALTNYACALDRSFIEHFRPAILHRSIRNVHKGSFGSLGILGGTSGMCGAPLLAGRAAARLGAGKVRVGFVSDAPAFDPNCLELMLHSAMTLLPVPHDAWIVGCGLGTTPVALKILEGVLDAQVPLVLDADALTLLGQRHELATRIAVRNAPTLLTPHPAEAARLLQSTTADVQHNRIAAAQAIAQRYRAHTLLKGNGSVTAHPDGSWCINTTGNPALAFGGSGDVLAGMIGALLAQGVEAATALRYAACLHGAAADYLVEKGKGPVGVLSDDLIQAAMLLLQTKSVMD